VVTLVLPRQRKRATEMLAKAGVKPTESRVRAGDPKLAEVTGARPPSGIPVQQRHHTPEKNRRPVNGGPKNRFPRRRYGENAGADRR
jgi:hypothetical protein